MKKIFLTKGLFTTVDDEDFERLSMFKWYAIGKGNHIYAARSRWEQKPYVSYLHREIMNPKQNEEVDHINGDRLNNQKSNLRICSHMENLFNRTINIRNKSGYKGVHFNKSRCKWISQITENKRYHFLGRFETKDLAIKAYDEAATKYHGQYARTNNDRYE